MERPRRVRGRVVTPEGLHDDAVVTLSDGRIASVEAVRGPLRSSPDLVELPGHVVYPGWINLHVHGARGLDFADPAPDAPGTIARYLAGQGWAGFLATYLARPEDALCAALAHLASSVGDPAPDRATALGVHFEGPFLNPERKGSHRSEDLRAPSPQLLERLLDAVPRGLAALVTMAPELEGGAELIAAALRRGAIPSLGHSQATYTQAMDAIARGVRHAVHLFNASSPLAHREPGVPGAFLTSPGTTCEVIPDLVHLHPAVLKLAIRARGDDGLVLVTDSIAPAGLGEGTHAWAGRPVHVAAGKATLSDGTVAGSVLETPRMLSILEELGVGPEAVARMASLHPARALGQDRERGRVAPGYRADLTVIGPDRVPSLTICDGRVVHSALR